MITKHIFLILFLTGFVSSQACIYVLGVFTSLAVPVQLVLVSCFTGVFTTATALVFKWIAKRYHLEIKEDESKQP